MPYIINGACNLVDQHTKLKSFNKLKIHWTLLNRLCTFVNAGSIKVLLIDLKQDAFVTISLHHCVSETSYKQLLFHILIL